MTTEFCSSFGSLAGSYDAFILDLWGVIHDGQNLYPGAKECLEQLKVAGKKIVLLSNAPRRAASVAEVMDKMGATSDLYDALITSGETAYKCIEDAALPLFPAGGGKYIYLGLEKDRSILTGLPYKETMDLNAANFLLISHPYYDNQPHEELEPLIMRCLASKLPAVCINPDMEVVRQSGEQVYCAGAIAAEYEARGGKVTYFGKPHPLVYEACFKIFADIPRQRILAVGDNMATDIAGAKKNDLKSALVTGGVLKGGVGKPGTDAYREKVLALLEKSDLSADYVLPAFNW